MSCRLLLQCDTCKLTSISSLCQIQYRAVLNANQLYTSGTPPKPTATAVASDSQPSYSTIRQVLARTYSNEGFRGFYKGLGTNLVRIAPGASLTLLVYERMSVSQLVDIRGDYALRR